GPTAVRPAMVTLDLGLGQLITALAGALTETDVRLGTRATALERTGDGFQIDVEDGSARATLRADAIVVATPAFVTADLVESLAPTAATELRDVPYVDVATITLTYPADAVGRPLDATGFLVPPAEGRLLVGCSWLSAKWPHLSSENIVVLRAMVGRAGDQRWVSLDDATLIRRVCAELAEAMGLSAEPLQTHVQRWPGALPQYTVGHQDRLNRLDAALAKVPGLHVTGAAYRGAGVAACIAQAEETATRALAGLAVLTQAQMSHP
ncbi:MAG TPA: protoporphyrinogen oxidase, partial [Acidothermaceae bacterium]|nr:protoporphyrinogen oxidase [Acidothermaceae bacterium]